MQLLNDQRQIYFKFRILEHIEISPLTSEFVKTTKKPAIFYHMMTAQKMKFSIKDFFRKCDQIRSFLGMWSHILKKSLMENFIFCAVDLLIF